MHADGGFDDSRSCPIASRGRLYVSVAVVVWETSEVPRTNCFVSDVTCKCRDIYRELYIYAAVDGAHGERAVSVG